MWGGGCWGRSRRRSSPSLRLSRPSLPSPAPLSPNGTVPLPGARELPSSPVSDASPAPYPDPTEGIRCVGEISLFAVRPRARQSGVVTDGRLGVVRDWALKYPLAPRWQRDALLSLRTVDG